MGRVCGRAEQCGAAEAASCEKYDLAIGALLAPRERNHGINFASCKFRDEILLLGYGIKCNGSLLNAVQSNMMSATDKVYLVELGKKAELKNIVCIWDYAEVNYFPNTKQQNDFVEKWVNNLN
ncbi:hypothetical protein [uncultured Campylobacter sp.]|uniref:hypothetical protein n=1 Tax=uncultured Campylobacter sp. TaxID=218934 RepID=UPI002604DFDC|nr:hypothetical protein [uncultured Campylobacter sp.]